MRISPRQVNDLLNLIDHARRDIEYGWGGTYGGYEESDKQAAKESKQSVKNTERAINFIKKLILERN